jgi:hypothetical protein
MTNDPLNDLEWRRMLEALPREISPQPDLENRTVRALRKVGVFKKRRSGILLLLLRVAAGIALLGLGYLCGQRASTLPEGTTRYLLLLWEDESFDVPRAGPQVLVAEYRNWASTLRRERHFLGGEDLEPSATRLPERTETITSEHVGGFFLITASGDAEALAIARTCPHLRHHGRIELRRVRPT